jgi:hypothetical protein
LGNISLFASYLVYDEPLRKREEATERNIYWFLADWFARNALWASARSVHVFCASLKKFFQWMGQTRRVSQKLLQG